MALNGTINLKRPIDYVLVYERPDYNDEEDENVKMNREKQRQFFTSAIKAESLEIEEEKIGKYIFVKIYCPFERLCQEAQLLKMEFPLVGLDWIVSDTEEGENNKEAPKESIEQRVKKILDIEQKQSHVVVPFLKDCRDWFITQEQTQTFFLSSTRTLLVHNILINIDLSKLGNLTKISYNTEKQGLPYLLLHDVYLDAFILHDKSASEPHNSVPTDSSIDLSSDVEILPPTTVQDTRRILNSQWTRLFRSQPIHLIRDYFGEKIAFYFAWVGTLIVSLFIPVVLGAAVFLYGVITRLTHDEDVSLQRNETVVPKRGAMYALDVIKSSSDNMFTPGFAFIICVWGTIFMEIWKRKQATLAHIWHVENFDMAEPERPGFCAIDTYEDTVTHQLRGSYPFKYRIVKYLFSISILVLMVCVVFISVTSVILYRLYIEVNFCDENDNGCRMLHGTVIATLLNTISIMILGKIYDFVAVKLTDWENHQTQSNYNDALIIKLFAFQFANTYTSLFYTAFFRKDVGSKGFLGLGEEYQDNCGDQDNDNCMSLLSFQLLVLMIMKPFPKFVKDIVYPAMKSLCRQCGLRQLNSISNKQHYLIREMFKQKAEDFRLGEFTEKTIQYGYLMLFAASFPLAPLLALVFNGIDLRVDSKRLLWLNQRPIPYRDNDIGIWFHILNFINVCGTISNGCLIAFTSRFGRQYEFAEKLIIVLIFEHLVFFVKFLVDLAIPDVPETVKLDRKRDRFVVAHFMSRVSASSERSDWATSRIGFRRYPVHPFRTPRLTPMKDEET